MTFHIAYISVSFSYITGDKMTALKCLAFVIYIILYLGLKVLVLIKMHHYVEIAYNYLCFISRVLGSTVH
jgi:hypothetical protein